MNGGVERQFVKHHPHEFKVLAFPDCAHRSVVEEVGNFLPQIGTHCRMVRHELWPVC
jgi:hypothetical protein